MLLLISLVPTRAEDAHPPLKMDVQAAIADAERGPVGVTRLPEVGVKGRKPLASSLPCIGCDGHVLVPFKPVIDVTDFVKSLFAQRSAAPQSPEDRARAFAQSDLCVDGSFGCLVRPQQP